MTLLVLFRNVSRVSGSFEILFHLPVLTLDIIPLRNHSTDEDFHIAAEEKGWPRYHVEKHFKRYLEDQTLPEYVKEFLEDGKEYVNAYRPKRGNFFDKKLLVVYSLFALLMIGGSFVICYWILPLLWPIIPGGYGNAVWYNPEWNPTAIEQRFPER